MQDMAELEMWLIVKLNSLAIGLRSPRRFSAVKLLPLDFTGEAPLLALALGPGGFCYEGG